jgi:hypothetical protein
VYMYMVATFTSCDPGLNNNAPHWVLFLSPLGLEMPQCLPALGSPGFSLRRGACLPLGFWVLLPLIGCRRAVRENNETLRLFDQARLRVELQVHTAAKVEDTTEKMEDTYTPIEDQKMEDTYTPIEDPQYEKPFTTKLAAHEATRIACLDSNNGGGGGWSEGARPSLPKYSHPVCRWGCTGHRGKGRPHWGLAG